MISKDFNKNHLNALFKFYIHLKFFQLPINLNILFLLSKVEPSFYFQNLEHNFLEFHFYSIIFFLINLKLHDLFKFNYNFFKFHYYLILKYLIYLFKILVNKILNLFLKVSHA